MSDRSEEVAAAETLVYLLWNGELLIDAPASVIWPHVLNYPEWQHFSITNRVAGRPNEEGEIVLLKKIEAGFDFPPYHARTIKIESERRIIWKTYPEHTEDRSFFGIVDFVLNPHGGQTRFSYNLLYEFVRRGETEEEVARFTEAQRKSSQNVFDVIFPRLKRISEDSLSTAERNTHGK
jgi:hypothetical protein